MPISIHEQLGQHTVNQIDQLAVHLGVEIENMPAFAAGRNTASWLFAERDVPEDLAEVISVVQKEAVDTPFSGHVDKPEFTLGSIVAAYAIRHRRN